MNRPGVAPAQAAAQALPLDARRQVFGEVAGDIDGQAPADAGHATGETAERLELHPALLAPDPHFHDFPPGH
jgi:hypothetical protein